MVHQESKYLLKDIYKKCAICHKYQHPKRKPNDFNQVFVLDLHEFGPDLWYLHMIVLFSRLSMAVVIHSKEAGVIVDKFIQNQVAIYGTPEIGLFTNIGLEFNKSFQEIAKKLNLSLKTTAANSP